jgi:hypothetical protein
MIMSRHPGRGNCKLCLYETPWGAWKGAAIQVDGEANTGCPTRPKRALVGRREVDEAVLHVGGFELDTHFGTDLELAPAAHQHAFGGR